MNLEPRSEAEYSTRQTEAARRVLVDLGQVLASFLDCFVVVGGWVPDLLLPHTGEQHIGSVDVDLALDAAKLKSGRYAELLQLLLNTRRYKQSSKPFQLVVEVDLSDGERPVQVEVDFLAPQAAKLQKNKPKLLKDFRVLQADACGTAFHAPVETRLSGKMVNGGTNTVRLCVASISDFLVMKAHAIKNREKPKDVYDLCYCLEYFPDGINTLAAEWKQRQREQDVALAVTILREKFSDVNAFGPQQLVEFHSTTDTDEADRHSRRAFELVRKLLALYDQS